MGSEFSTLYEAVTDALGNDSTKAVTVAKRGVNFAQIVIAITYDPPELKTTGTLTISAAGTSVALSTLTNLRVINSIYNTTASKDLTFIPRSKFKLVVPTGLTYSEYYYRHGNTLYVNAPTAANYLSVEYTKFPTELVNGTDVCEILKHDSVIVSLATSYSFASYEEGESATIWEKVLELYAAAFAINAKQLVEYKEALEASGYNI